MFTGDVPILKGIDFLGPVSTYVEREAKKHIPYVSAVGSLMYA